MKDKQSRMSISQLARITGRDRATIASRLQNLTAVEEMKAKLYDTVEALPVIYAAESFKGIQKKIELTEHEIAKEKLNKIKLENEQQMGKLVPITEIAKTVEKEYSFVIAQIRALPGKVAKSLATETDPAAVFEILSEGINECLLELSFAEKYETYLNELENKNVSNESLTKSPAGD